VFIPIYVHTYVYIHMCITYVYIYVYIYVNIYKHTYLYIHINIYVFRVPLLRRGSDHDRGSSAPDEGRDGPEGASSSVGFPKHMNPQSDREKEGVTQVSIEYILDSIVIV
jgi:hypothetical protein